VKTSIQVRSGLAVAALLGAAVLAACGGGSTSVPTTAPPTAQLPSNGSVPIGSLDLMHSASSTPVNVTGSKPSSQTVDVRDQNTIALSGKISGNPDISDPSQHGFTGTLRGQSTASKQRSAKDVAVNSLFDIVYHGGTVVGSSVQHNIFVNCVASCRDAENYFPGTFENNLNNDQFITVQYQYLSTPGVVDSTPVTGRYPKGPGADISPTYASPRPGSTNPYYGQLSILLQVLAAAPNISGDGSDGSGYGHIYHVFLPQNVDTCFESPLGTPTTTCYSPDNGATFFFCAYHGSFTSSGKVYLYSVEPYQDVNGCRNQTHNQTLPNRVSPTVDPADPGYSTLSHEIFETINDPRGNAWWNNFTQGEEIADLCADFDNFVTINGAPYVLQSEYSDINHLCVSANLAGPAQTPQQSPAPASAARSVH
jgi:hypothetical protein